MAGRQVVDLGHRVFQTKAAAQKYFREAISQRQVGEKITEQDPLYRDIAALLQRHPERDQKVGVGLQSFAVHLDAAGNRMLCLERLDGSTTDFSYVSCVRGAGPTLDKELAEAARAAVRDDIAAIKVDFFRQHQNEDGLAPCQETGRLMSIADAHVDHWPLTFEALLRQFCARHNVVAGRDILEYPRDNQTFTAFVCEQTKSLWLEFHRANATLLVVHSRVNLTRKRKVDTE